MMTGKESTTLSAWWQDQAIKTAFVAQQRAVAPYSDILVGAAIVASHNLSDELCVFSGSNVELADKENIHAERMAMAKAVLAEYAFPHLIVVTSQSTDEDAALCLDCRKLFMKINPKLRVIVVNPNGGIKLDLELEKDLVPHHYRGKIK